MECDKSYREKLYNKYPTGIPSNVQHSVVMVMAYYFPEIDYEASIDDVWYLVTVRVDEKNIELVRGMMVEKMPSSIGVDVVGFGKE